MQYGQDSAMSTEPSMTATGIITEEFRVNSGARALSFVKRQKILHNYIFIISSVPVLTVLCKVKVLLLPSVL